MKFSSIQFLLTKKSFMVLIERNVSVSKLKLEVMTVQCITLVFIAIHHEYLNEKLTGLRFLQSEQRVLPFRYKNLATRI